VIRVLRALEIDERLDAAASRNPAADPSKELPTVAVFSDAAGWRRHRPHIGDTPLQRSVVSMAFG
jgi:hypothetical protein